MITANASKDVVEKAPDSRTKTPLWALLTIAFGFPMDSEKTTGRLFFSIYCLIAAYYLPTFCRNDSKSKQFSYHFTV